MAKSKIAGFDDFLRKTEASSKSANSTEKLTLINFQVPVSLKKKISKHCIENDISIRNFITNLIEEKLCT
ncbi:MAG: hypothetical protein LBG15_07225 [Dysgonamonadaceae bacterium]|jgi:hypothetical protein|nr:hypothetical protein [Dysgonamonadaceae bacterium]